MDVEEDSILRQECSGPECVTSAFQIDTAPVKASGIAKKRPSFWGNIRHVTTAYELLNREAELDARGGGYQLAPDEAKGEPLFVVESPRSGSFDAAQDICNEGDLVKEVLGVSESEYRTDDGNEEELVEGDVDGEKMKAIAVQALTAISEEDEDARPPSTPLNQFQRGLMPATQLPSSPAIVSPPSSHARSPLRSPCWRTLVPVTPPPGGYWKPSTTEKGVKNTPMCPPCRSGKKGRCYGGLPCDRCKDKGYTKERCEGSLVFQFSPKKKVVKDDKVVDFEKGSAVNSGKWKRDSFGRFS